MLLSKEAEAVVCDPTFTNSNYPLTRLSMNDRGLLEKQAYSNLSFESAKYASTNSLLNDS